MVLFFGYESYFYMVHNIKENLFKNFAFRNMHNILSENFLVKSQNIIGAIDLSIYKYVIRLAMYLVNVFLESKGCFSRSRHV